MMYLGAEADKFEYYSKIVVFLSFWGYKMVVWVKICTREVFGMLLSSVYCTVYEKHDDLEWKFRDFVKFCCFENEK